MGNNNKDWLTKLVQFIPQSLKAIKESIQQIKAIGHEFVPVEPISDEQIENYVNPFYKELIDLKEKLKKHDWFNLQTDIKKYVSPLEVPNAIKKTKKRWNDLQFAIDQMDDLSKQLSNLCLGVVNEAMRKHTQSNVNLSSDLVKQLANYALLPTQNNLESIESLDEKIKPSVYEHLKGQYSGAQLEIEVKNTVSELTRQILHSLSDSNDNIPLSKVLQDVREELQVAANDLVAEIESDLKKLQKVQRKQNLQKDE